jgi:AcrR family transcriptional regulator
VHSQPHTHGQNEGPEDAAEARAPGLRERKKLATREALGAAAIRLAIERGFENLRVDDIADAAGVSPRTFNNYFSSREQAICAMRNAHVERIAAALRARPVGEPLIDSLINAVVTDYGREPNRDIARLIHCTPTVSAEFLRSAAEAQVPLMEAIAERTGTSPDDLLPAVIAATVLGAQRVAMDQWTQSENPPPYKTLLRDALNQLRALSDPPQATAGDAVSAAVSPASAPLLIIGNRDS